MEDASKTPTKAQPVNGQSQSNSDTTHETYYQLWEYFSKRADDIKDRMWTISTWMLGIAGAVLVYGIGNDNLTFTPGCVQPNQRLLLMVLSGLGILLCSLTGLLVDTYQTHIKRNEERSIYLKLHRLPEVNDVFENTDKKILSGPAFQVRDVLKAIARLLILLFAILFIFSAIGQRICF